MKRKTKCGKQRCKKPGLHAHCKDCGYTIAITETICGECACEVETL